ALGGGVRAVGLIRKSLYLGSGGLVSPNSKKQRRQIQMIKAMQGASDAEIRRAGGRYDFAGFWGDVNARTQAHSEPEPMAKPSRGAVQAVVRSARERGGYTEFVAVTSDRDEVKVIVRSAKLRPYGLIGERLTGNSVYVVPYGDKGRGNFAGFAQVAEPGPLQPEE